VDYDPPALEPELSNIHFTIGGPYFTEYADCKHADLWLAEREDMLHCDQHKDMTAKTS
jgi:hypothetical protein